MIQHDGRVGILPREHDDVVELVGVDRRLEDELAPSQFCETVEESRRRQDVVGVAAVADTRIGMARRHQADTSNPRRDRELLIQRLGEVMVARVTVGHDRPQTRSPRVTERKSLQVARLLHGSAVCRRLLPSG